MAQDAGADEPSAEGADDVQGVDLDGLATPAVRERAAGRPGQAAWMSIRCAQTSLVKPTSSR